jgi:phosphatidylglycerophosphate synthase
VYDLQRHRETEVNPRAIAPCVVTLAGLVAGIVGVWNGSPALLLLSIALDVADGALARRIGGVSTFGARLDFLSDVALAHAVLVRAELPWAMPILLVGQALADAHAVRVSGRAALFGMAALAIVLA